MTMKRAVPGLILSMCLGAGCAMGAGDADEANIAPAPGLEPAVSAQTAKLAAGQLLFNDTNLSSPAGQSCASCHTSFRAFTDPDNNVPTSEGVIAGRFGNRNTPTAMYAQYSPDFHYDADAETWVGGQFWDGRASTLEDQAKGPFLNPIEMNNPDKATVVNKVRASSYAYIFRMAFGQTSLDDVDTAYDHIAEAIAAYERTKTFAPFTSKYDAYLAGTATLTAQEARGLAIFEDPNKGNCAACHPSRPAADGTPPLFTDFTYDNLGLPKNPKNPFYNEPQFNPAGSAYLDRGLGATVGDPSLDGAFKVPTLRNLSVSWPYMHNGYFYTLNQVVHFYNTRDTASWPAPEFPATMNTEELGHLGLTIDEENDLTVFLYTLNDGWKP
jgi:cytochrome c peroxidase